MRKPTIWVQTRSDTNQAVQSQKQARSLKFWIKEEEEFYCPCSEKTKALISFAVTAKLIRAFVFAYASCWFSHAAAQILDFFETLHNSSYTSFIVYTEEYFILLV